MALKIKENRTIVLPIDEKNYDLFIKDIKIAHEVIKSMYDIHPEFFPLGMSEGYMCNGNSRKSKKLDLQYQAVKGTNGKCATSNKFNLFFASLSSTINNVK